jgi:hypothetical protein
MEITCTRCHQTILAENTYCPSCGLPHLVCSAEGGAGTGSDVAERLSEPVRDAGSVDWKAALRAVLMLAVPAGILSSEASPFSLLGVIWMAGAAAMAVIIYLRSRRPGWITTGAGARIGLVTGLLGGWLAFAISGTTLYVQRYFLHQAGQIDGDWKTALLASQELTQQWMAGMSSPEMAQAQSAKAQVWMLSPGGHAGWAAFGFACDAVFLLFFAVAGGALGAWYMARTKRPEA